MNRTIIIVILIALVAGGAWILTGGTNLLPGSTAEATATPIPPIEAPDGVIAEARVVPLRSAELRFEQNGVVAELLVAEGSDVAAGEVLARQDSRELELRVAEVEARRNAAAAELERLREGATEEEIAAAEAELARARASLRREQGQVTAQEIAAAQARLQATRSRLAELEAGADAADLAAAHARVDAAAARLQNQRDQLSAAKTQAELALQRSANALRDAQDEYSRIYWDNRELEEALDNDIPQENKDREAAALRAVQDAETALEQARLALEQAQQAEISGLRIAEAELRDSQAALRRLESGSDADVIEGARAEVAAATANLAALQGEARAGSIAAAQAGVESAEAGLAQVSAGPRESALAVAAARLEEAEVALRQAELALEKSVLRAPFAGTIAALHIEAGEVAPASGPALVLADIGTWQIRTEDLTELDVVQLRPGDEARIRFDALPDTTLSATVDRIVPLGENRQGDIVYTVVLIPEESEEQLFWNMTAVVEVER